MFRPGRALLVVLLALAPTAARAQPEPRAKLEHDGPINCLTFSPDGKLLASGDRDGVVRLWNVGTGKEVHKLDTGRGEILTAVFAPHGKTLATSGTDGIIRLWHTATGKEASRLETPFAVNAIAFTGNGERLIVADGEGNISFLDPATMKEAASFKVPPSLRWVAPLGDGHTLAVLCVKHVRVEEKLTVEATLRYLAADSGKELRQAKFAADRVTLSGDGHSIAGRADDGGLTLRELAGGQERCRLAGSFASVTLTADGRFLFAADTKDHVIHIHDLVAGKEVVRLDAHEATVGALAVSPDGRTLASGGNDFTVYLWDLALLERKRPLPPLTLTAKDAD
jgi:WD40 repeat protein